MRLTVLVRRYSFRIGIPLLVGMMSVTPAAAVTLRVTSATVQAAGDMGQICVQLETQGKLVAGTQNDLVWDGGCATLASTDSCTVNSAHGKDLSSAFPPPPPDFAFRAIVISLGNVDPIDDTELYCCAFQSESPPGSCCSIDIMRAGASDSGGTSLSVSGVGGEICTASEGRAGGGLTGGQGFGTDRPSSAQDSGVTDQAPREPAAPAGGGGGETAPAADAVLPGGGVTEPVAPGPATTDLETTEPPAGAPEEIARQEAAPLAEGEAGRPPAPADQEPLAASPDATPMTAAEEPSTLPSPAPTTPGPTEPEPTASEPTVPADTPTSKPAATVPPTAAQAAAAAPSEDKGGWGCEIVPGGGGGLGPLAIVLVALLIVTRFRGTSAQTTRFPPKPSA